MILATLLGEAGHETPGLGSDSHNQRGKDGSTATQRVLGSTWLPVSSNVMERGHLEEGYDRRRQRKKVDVVPFYRFVSYFIFESLEVTQGGNRHFPTFLRELVAPNKVEKRDALSWERNWRRTCFHDRANEWGSTLRYNPQLESFLLFTVLMFFSAK